MFAVSASQKAAGLEPAPCHKAASAAGAGISSGRADFRSELRGAGQAAAASKGHWEQAVEAAIEHISVSWSKTNSRSAHLINNAPASVRPYFELQLAVNSLALETNLISRVGETLSATVRQVQQMAGR